MSRVKNVSKEKTLIGNRLSELSEFEIKDDLTKKLKKLVEAHSVLSDNGLNLTTTIDLLLCDSSVDKRYVILDRTTVGNNPVNPFSKESIIILFIDSYWIWKLLGEFPSSDETEKRNQVVDRLYAKCIGNLLGKVSK